MFGTPQESRDQQHELSALRDRDAGLTSHERQVTAVVVSGWLNKQFAAQHRYGTYFVLQTP